MFLASRWRVRSVEQTILRAGEKMPKHTMPWICRTRTSITESSLSRNLDHLEDRRSKQFGGSLQSSLLLRLSRSISMLLTECSTYNKTTRQKSLSFLDKFTSNCLVLHHSCKRLNCIFPLMHSLWPICDGVAQSREKFKLGSNPVRVASRGTTRVKPHTPSVPSQKLAGQKALVIVQNGCGVGLFGSNCAQLL